MDTLLTLFYRLPLDFITPCLLIAALVFLKLHVRFGARGWFRRSLRLILILWFGVMLFATVLNRTSDTGVPPKLIPFHSYCTMFATGNDELMRSNFMNVALFFPAGLLTAALLPERWPRLRLVLTTAVLFALFSAGIEFAQFRWVLGEPEIDDVIHNTLGAVLGALPIAFRAKLYTPSQA